MKDKNIIFDILIGILLFIGLSFYYVILRTEVVKLGYELSSTQKKRSEALEKNAKLNLELSALKSPQRIEPLARKLGLNYPLQDQIVELRVK